MGSQGDGLDDSPGVSDAHRDPGHSRGRGGGGGGGGDQFQSNLQRTRIPTSYAKQCL